MPPRPRRRTGCGHRAAIRLSTNSETISERLAVLFYGLLPASVRRIASLVEIDVIEDGLYIGSVVKPALRKPSRQRGHGGIVPADLSHELVPDMDVVLLGGASVFVAPRQEFVVASAFQC